MSKYKEEQLNRRMRNLVSEWAYSRRFFNMEEAKAVYRHLTKGEELVSGKEKTLYHMMRAELNSNMLLEATNCDRRL